MEPQIMVGLNNSFVKQKVSNEDVVSYVSGISGVGLYSRGTEIELALISTSLFSNTITAKRGATEITGKLISVVGKYITIEQEDGSVVTTRYDSFITSLPRYPRDSYRVRFNPEGIHEQPTLHYETSSISWSPHIRIEVNKRNGTATFSLNAIITSTQETSMRGQFTVTSSRSLKFQDVGFEIRIDQSSSSSSSSSYQSDLDEPFTYTIGTFSLAQHVIYPIYINPITVNPVSIIEFGDTNISGPSVMGFITTAPFAFPSSTLEIKDGDFHAKTTIPSHQKSQDLLVRTHLSTQTQFSTRTQHSRSRIDIIIDIDHDGLKGQQIIFLYPVASSGPVEVTPEVTPNIKFPGYLVWVTKLKKPQSSIKFTIQTN